MHCYNKCFIVYRSGASLPVNFYLLPDLFQALEQVAAYWYIIDVIIASKIVLMEI